MTLVDGWGLGDGSPTGGRGDPPPVDVIRVIPLGIWGVPYGQPPFLCPPIHSEGLIVPPYSALPFGP